MSPIETTECNLALLGVLVVGLQSRDKQLADRCSAALLALGGQVVPWLQRALGQPRLATRVKGRLASILETIEESPPADGGQAAKKISVALID